MSKFQLFGSLAALAFLAGAAQAGPPVRTSVGIGINFGAPAPYYRPYPYYAPYYRPYPVYYPPPAVYVQPAPIVYQQAPVVVQSPPVVQPAPVYSAPEPQPQPQPTIYRTSQPSGAAIDGLLGNLRNSDENVRRDSVMELGRSKAPQAVQPLTATLAGDQSPVVREAAARALAIIGSPQALTALQYAAQSDTDRDVRHSAQFAVEVIRANSR